MLLAVDEDSMAARLTVKLPAILHKAVFELAPSHKTILQQILVYTPTGTRPDSLIRRTASAKRSPSLSPRSVSDMRM